MLLIHTIRFNKHTHKLIQRDAFIIAICSIIAYLINKCFFLENFITLFVCVCIFTFCSPVKSKALHWFRVEINPFRRAVLITGCDSGFGFNIAKILSKKGFQIFAGCLQPSENGGKELSLNSDIHCFKLDVKNPKDVKEALRFVTQTLGENELWAVINNAGIAAASEIEVISMTKLEDVLNVNLLGTIRMTKAFLPLLRKARGRVVNVASMLGMIMTPGSVPYSMSKSAAISFSDGLRLEVERFGVSVITIEPFMYRTNICDPRMVLKNVEDRWNEAEESIKPVYKDIYERRVKRTTRGLYSWMMNPNIEEVTNVMADAVTCFCPPYSYQPGNFRSTTLFWFLYLMPKTIRNLMLDIIYS